MAHRFLVVTSQFPYPPRNGVTIPVCGYIELLLKLGQVDLLVLDATGLDGDWSDARADIRSTWGLNKVVFGKKVSRSLLRRVGEELLFVRASFDDDFVITKGNGFDVKEYDMVIVSPITPLGCVQRMGVPAERMVAAISDVYTSVLDRNRAQTSLTFNGGVRWMINSLRLATIKNIEARMLRGVRTIFVQSVQDKAWLSYLGGGELASRAVVLPNGIRSDLLGKQCARFESKRLLFVASNLSDSANSLIRFIGQCWPVVKRCHADATFRVVGRIDRAPSELRNLILTTDGIEHVSFAENIHDIYSDCTIAVAFVDKSYGYLNKVGEALAVGLPVVGDVFAFASLPHRHELGDAVSAVADLEGAALAVCNLMGNEGEWKELSSRAIGYANMRMTWESRMKCFQAAVELQLA